MQLAAIITFRFRPVQPLIKPGQIVGNPHLCGRNVVRIKSRLIMELLQSFLMSNCRKTTVKVWSLIVTVRALKGLGRNSCATVRKPLISEANRGKKCFNLLASTKTGAVEEDYVVRRVQVCPVPEWRTHQEKQTGLWNDAPFMCCASHTSLGQFCAVMWGWCGWSGSGSAMLHPWGMRADNDLGMLKDQVIQWLDEFFPTGFVKLCMTFVNTTPPKLEELLDQPWKDARDLIKQCKKEQE